MPHALCDVMLKALLQKVLQDGPEKLHIFFSIHHSDAIVHDKLSETDFAELFREGMRLHKYSW